LKSDERLIQIRVWKKREKELRNEQCKRRERMSETQTMDERWYLFPARVITKRRR